MSLKSVISERFVNYLNTLAGGKRIPYGIGSRFLYKYCQTPVALKKRFKRKDKIFNAFLDELNIQKDRERLKMEKFIIGFHKNWRGMSFSYVKNQKVNKYMSLEGFDIFKQYYEEMKTFIKERHFENL